MKAYIVVQINVNNHENNIGYYKMEGEDYKNFDIVVSKLRSFFKDVKGFKEVHTQNKKSILAACEDPTTIATYNYEGQIWPLPQTGQMW